VQYQLSVHAASSAMLLVVLLIGVDVVLREYMCEHVGRMSG